MSRSFTRRDFLGGSLGAGAVGALSATLGPGPALAPLGLRSSVPSVAKTGELTTKASSPERTLVLCTLYGGNDGLNTVVPYESGVYKSLRQGCAITEDQALPIGAFDNLKLGLHPALPGMKSLWDAGQVAIVLGVGYPNPNYSHFESMEIMQSADPSGDNPTGWLGRWLDVSGTSPVRALSIGPNLPQVFEGAVSRPRRSPTRPIPVTSSPMATTRSSLPTESSSTPTGARPPSKQTSPKRAPTCSSWAPRPPLP